MEWIGGGLLLFLPLAVGIFVVALFFTGFAALNQKSRELITLYRKLTPQQRRTSFALMGGVVLLAFISGDMTKSAQLAILQKQFQLPADTSVTGVRVAKHSSAARPSVQGIARFTDEQFRHYARMVEEPNQWQPGLVNYGGAPVSSYSSKALQWQDGNRPAFVGDRRVRWGHVSAGQADKIRGGKYICFALLGHGGGPSSAVRSNAHANYSALACSEFNRGVSPTVYVLGALDYDTKTLHMIIN